MAILSGQPRRARCARLALACALGALSTALLPTGARGAEPSVAAPAPAREYQVKAVFLFNFAQFVEWPARAFPSREAPLVIGILGADPFGAYLDNEIVRGETVAGRPIAVRRYRSVDEIKDCHILFIAAESGRLDRVLAALKGRSILTVSDAENFSALGGMVRFATESGKIRLRIDDEAARAAGLIISSKILRSATIVTKEKP